MLPTQSRCWHSCCATCGARGCRQRLRGSYSSRSAANGGCSLAGWGGVSCPCWYWAEGLQSMQCLLVQQRGQLLSSGSHETLSSPPSQSSGEVHLQQRAVSSVVLRPPAHCAPHAGRCAGPTCRSGSLRSCSGSPACHGTCWQRAHSRGSGAPARCPSAVGPAPACAQRAAPATPGCACPVSAAISTARLALSKQT